MGFRRRVQRLRPHPRGWHPLFWPLDHSLHHIDLALARHHKRNCIRMVDHRQRQRYALRGWLWRVLDRRDPPVRLCEELMAREERRSVPVVAHAEEDKVEARVLDRVFEGELADELLLVSVGELLHVFKEAGIDGVDLRGRDGHFGVEGLRAEEVV